MHNFHASKVAGHLGFVVTYIRLRRHIAWPKMKNQIKQFVQSCLIYQQSKPDYVKYPRTFGTIIHS
jgi:hypothetical protein